MKYYALINSADGFIVEEVDGKKATFCKDAFIYKRGKIYHLVDIQTGLSIVRSFRMNYLNELFDLKKQEYEKYRKTDAYRIKVERFEKMKVISNYSKGVK